MGVSLQQRIRRSPYTPIVVVRKSASRPIFQPMHQISVEAGLSGLSAEEEGKGHVTERGNAGHQRSAPACSGIMAAGEDLPPLTAPVVRAPADTPKPPETPPPSTAPAPLPENRPVLAIPGVTAPARNRPRPAPVTPPPLDSVTPREIPSLEIPRELLEPAPSLAPRATPRQATSRPNSPPILESAPIGSPGRERPILTPGRTPVQPSGPSPFDAGSHARKPDRFPRPRLLSSPAMARPRTETRRSQDLPLRSSLGPTPPPTPSFSAGSNARSATQWETAPVPTRCGSSIAT